MARKAEDIKKELERRRLKRHAKPEIDEVENGEVTELEATALADMEEDLEDAGDYEIVEDFEAIIAMSQEEGYTAYCEGAELAANPYLLYEEEDADTKNMYVAAWEEGWVGAHTEACVTSVVLAARKLVQAETEEKATEMFARLEESLDALGEVSDLEEWEDPWTE